MWETIKSIAFVITTVMLALIFQARASNVESNSISRISAEVQAEEQIEQLDFASGLPSHFQNYR